MALGDLQKVALLLIGMALGFVLFKSSFGFSSAYRQLITQRDVRGVQAQIVMVGAATLLFAPILAIGSAFGHELYGSLAPTGVQVAAGAFLFGIGMQLANGCASGTLFSIGSGSMRMLFVLVSFMTGSFLASIHFEWWENLPSTKPISLEQTLGWPLGAMLQVIFLFMLWRALNRWKGNPIKTAKPVWDWKRILADPWPLMTGGIVLAVLNLATLLIAGHPWSITWGFTLWGAKIAQLLGWNPDSSLFWQGEFQQAALHASVLNDVTSIMDIGLVLGAFFGALGSKRFSPTLQITPLLITAAILGGLLMGYGARIAYGCNVGAFFSGIASASLHGWLWIIAALPGVWVGVKLRPLFHLPS
jgi:uncharacterized membrane protein YedE/YeeE